MTLRNHQQGLSFIELLIAIALGVTLMSASLQFIVSTRQTYELNDDISRVQENGRIALDILTKDLRSVGYRDPSLGDQPSFFFDDCASASTVCLNEGGTTLSDRLAPQYDPRPDDGTETSCQGNAVPASSVVTNVYTIADLDNGGAGDGINSLYCQSYDSTTGNWIDANPMPLVDGIDNLQILYGIAADTSAANANSVTKYVSADKLDLTPPATPGDTNDMGKMRSVRIALLVSNGLAQGFGETKSRSYRLLDSNVITINDAQSRRIYSTTVQFNNYGQ